MYSYIYTNISFTLNNFMSVSCKTYAPILLEAAGSAYCTHLEHIMYIYTIY